MGQVMLRTVSDVDCVAGSRELLGHQVLCIEHDLCESGVAFCANGGWGISMNGSLYSGRHYKKQGAWRMEVLVGKAPRRIE